VVDDANAPSQGATLKDYIARDPIVLALGDMSDVTARNTRRANA